MAFQGHHSPAPRSVMRLAALAALLAPLAGPALSQDDPASALPPGPKQILLELVGEDVDALDALVSSDREYEDWLAYLETEIEGDDETAILILADYLWLNTPAETEGENAAQRIASLPLDGIELFVQSCQTCHGVESYYLVLDNTEEEWLDILEAPYHRRLLVEEGERETFVSYAARALPIAPEDVPEEWRD